MNLFGIKLGKGDVDGFLGLFFDNITVFLVIISLNLFVVKMPAEIVFGRILPGAAMGLLIGNIVYAMMAKKLAKDEERDDVTALPSGISIVMALVYTLGILLPVSIITGNPETAWMVGVVATVLGSIICFIGALVGPWLQKFLPKPAMLGALAGLAIVFIAGMNLADVFANPYIGFLSLGIIIWGYLAQGKMPFNIPAGFLALVLGSIIAVTIGQTVVDVSGIGFNAPFPWIIKISTTSIKESFGFFSIIIPIAIINFMSTLINVESAHAAGDKYPIRKTMLVDAAATLVGAVFGCCYPNNVFIGHPGYKRLGARGGYSLLSGIALVVLSVFGMFGFISKIVPLAAVTPILIFIGIIMITEAFTQVEPKHVVASAMAMLPFIGEFGFEQIRDSMNAVNMELVPENIIKIEEAGLKFTGYSLLANGTILISMFLASIVAFAIDREFKKIAIIGFTASLCSFLGLIHSPVLQINSNPQLTIAWAGLAILALLLGYSENRKDGQTLEV